MTQVGETIAILVATRDKDEPCWACKEEPEEKRKNELDEDPPSSKEENDVKNNSSKLGRALGGRPSWTINVPHPDGEGAGHVSQAVVPGAHHLIPGNESMKRVPKILDLIESRRGKIKADIGYDINAATNGVWLPGSYGVSTTSPLGTKWSNYDYKEEYALAAMGKAGAQFHDRHPKYSGKVKSTLRSLADKITLLRPEKCGICKEKLSDKARPPYGLVGRLNRLSRIYRSFLHGPTRKWPVETGFSTSRWSKLGKKNRSLT